MHTPKGVSVVDGGGETPGPIPNPEAKPARADGTAPGREWESRLPPTQQLHTQHPPHKHNRLCGGCLLLVLHVCGVSALQTTPPPPTIGVHPRIVRINTTRFVSSGCEQFLVQATVSVGDCGRVLVVVRMMVTSLGSPVGVLGIAVMSPASSAARAALMRLVSYCFQVPSSTLCGV